jgi:hypothetical protein
LPSSRGGADDAIRGRMGGPLGAGTRLQWPSGSPSAATIICKKPSSPEAAPATRGWTLSLAASAGGWLRPLPIELIAIGTNIHTASLSFQCLRNSRPKPVIGVAPASFFGSASTMIQEIGFALESPVDGTGFEPSVPRKASTGAIATHSRS